MQTGSSTISISTNRGHYFFSTEEIVRLEASSNYTKIYFSNKMKVVTAKVLKEFEIILSPLGFVRTHRAHLVNKQHILCITPDGNIIMKDASVAGVSRRMKSSVMKALKSSS